MAFTKWHQRARVCIYIRAVACVGPFEGPSCLKRFVTCDVRMRRLARPSEGEWAKPVGVDTDHLMVHAEKKGV